MATDMTYDQSNAMIAVPADTDATVTGVDDTITLSSGDQLMVDAAGNQVTAASDSAVFLSPGAYNTVIAVAGASTTLYRGTASNAGASATIAVGAGTTGISVAEQPGDTAPIAILVPSGAASLHIATFGDGDGNVLDDTQAFSANGTLLSQVDDADDGSSFVTAAGSGDFGIYQTVAQYSATQGQGNLLDTIYNIVVPVSGGYAAQSIVNYVAGNPGNPAGVLTETDRYSGANLSGSALSSAFDYTDGTSGLFTPDSGALGVYQTVRYYTGADQTGTLTATISDYVAPAAGGGVTEKSIADFTGNGDYGVFKTVLLTDQPDGFGTVTSTVLDIANGRSVTIAPGASGSDPETETVTSGLDGSGSVLSTTTVAAGTDAQLFNAFTENAAFPSASAELARASVTPADFAAKGGPGAAIVGANVKSAPLTPAQLAAAAATTLPVDPSQHPTVLAARPA